jgi:hypothetical protein
VPSSLDVDVCAKPNPGSRTSIRKLLIKKLLISFSRIVPPDNSAGPHGLAYPLDKRVNFDENRSVPKGTRFQY